MTIQDGINQVEQAQQEIVEANTLINDAIIHSFLFTWRWWLGIALFIVPWLIWLKYKKKDSSNRLFLAGLCSILLGQIIDMFALSMGKWSYPIKFIPCSGTTFLPYHFSMLPVGVMFAIQIKPKLNPILKGIILGLICAYLIEPFFTKTGFYNPKNWKYIYDVCIYFSIYNIAHLLTRLKHFGPIESKDE
ncbi:hypothetical protein LOZ80_10475 [Paenibacillus sp. HWE-109]|uniref:CBO0543 family protein n=1 Tax=Paenibacillus sp. HWE-109 TaxID=1306526 RepID=UPI001EDE5D8E|nr:CBO0543 family protein [Paenibacillus sp. HWE-109]UKS29324.1 hypothetical protein LOZ80_10475 [Paenibacillus sp. HWE-109]